MQFKKAFAPQIAQNAAAEIHLRLLATSDLHVHIMPFDYYTGTSNNRLGLTRTATLIAAARAEVENSLLFDNGDFLQGSPLGDFIAQSRDLRNGDIHPIFTAMNHLRYDAGTLGNHEFNFGLDFLQSALSGADFPIVAANIGHIDQPPPDDRFIAPYVILDRTVVDTAGARHPIKIGVIGFTPPQILIWDRRHLAGRLTTRDIVDAAITYVPQMRREGADLIVALSHSGIGPAQAVPGMEDASTALAAIDGIDAVITGHSHLVFPSADFASTAEIDADLGTLYGKPAVMPGFYGSHLGVIDLFLSRKAGRYAVDRHRSEARPIWQRDASGREQALVKSHLRLSEISSAIHLEALEWANKPIGHTAVPLHSFFALIADAPALQLVAAAQMRHAQKTLAGTGHGDLPILTGVAPFKAGGRGGPDNYTDVPAGNVMLRNASDLYIHPNTSAAIRMTGAEIAVWLEYAVGIFNQITPRSTDAPLIDPDFPSFNFDMIFGLGFQIDLGKPPRFDVRGALVNPQSQRIAGLTYQGKPLDPTAVFAVATNSYRVASYGGLPDQADGRVLFQSTRTNLEVVLAYFADPASHRPLPAPIPRFMPMPGTSVLFDTSPKAQDHLASLAHLKIEPVGLTASGFLRFRLHL